MTLPFGPNNEIANVSNSSAAMYVPPIHPQARSHTRERRHGFLPAHNQICFLITTAGTWFPLARDRMAGIENCFKFEMAQQIYFWQPMPYFT
jgi:hypothetical protein